LPLIGIVLALLAIIWNTLPEKVTLELRRIKGDKYSLISPIVFCLVLTYVLMIVVPN
jgi:hypothetical protein